MAFRRPAGSRARFPADNNIVPLWHAKCQLDRHDHPIPNLANACIALEQDPDWANRFHYNQMAYVPLLDGAHIEDEQLIAIHRAMQLKGLHRIGFEVVREAVADVSYKNPVHPLRDWLNSLEWDETLRLADWLHTCLGTADNAYYKAIGTMFLISMVARVFQPGCKADHMLVLEGPQRTLKSSACRTLASDPHFSDTLPDLSGDAIRVSMHLRGKWLIEVAELSAFNRADAIRLKSFLTTQVEQYTPKHARSEAREPRQCLFIGTTNDKQYLRDPTGSRRYWPVECGTINLNRLIRDRDQLFAEAAAYYRNGSQWWPDPAFEDRTIKPMQDSRYQGDVWETIIADWDRTDAHRDSNGRPVYLGNSFGEPPQPAPRVPLNGPPYFLIDIARGALHFDGSRLGRREELRLIAVLESLGWERDPRSKRGVPWRPPQPSSPLATV